MKIWTGIVIFTLADSHLLWRDDLRCGTNYDVTTLFLLSDNATVAKCNPDGQWPCCSNAGYCGWTQDHCECKGCIDYREKSERRKIQFEKVQIEARLKKLEEDLALADEVSKEKKAMEGRIAGLLERSSRIREYRNLRIRRCEDSLQAMAQLKETDETSISDLEERLSKEQIARQKSNEELKALKNELLDSLATTAAQQELRTKHEQELALLKKSLEEETGHHESQLMEVRHKHSQEMAVLHEQMDNAKKIKEALEKAKATLEAENADMANEIKSIATSKAETDRKRKHLESQVSELTSRLQESEGARSEVQDRLVRIQTDMESLVAQLVDAESRSVNATKSNANTELNEMQTQLEVETKQKLALNAKIRELESEKESLHYQVEDAEGAKRNFEEQISSLTVQLHEAKKHADNEAEALLQLEELRKRSSKDIESLQGQIEELKVQNDRLEKSKKKLQAELEDIIVDLENTYEDITIDLDSQRAKVIELEKKLRNFDKVLAEEKANSERFVSERDAAERDAREKETKVLSLSRDLEEYIVKVEELERSRRVLQNELDELANSQGTADKNTTMSNGAGHFVQPPTFGARNNALRILIHELLRGDPDALRTHTPNGAGHFVQPPSFGARNNALRIVIQELLRGDPDALRTNMSNSAGHLVQPPSFEARNNALRIFIHKLLGGDTDFPRVNFLLIIFLSFSFNLLSTLSLSFNYLFILKFLFIIFPS
ncbi:myosin heavy chain, non-muscle-like isoform X3 [Artemia franciscana]|uniref:myosin heavy chain, non-muscle-like isoform X3 n=1 Tax=Artemia franciscana TaxID=6661 RepID=UPI0032DA4C28